MFSTKFCRNVDKTSGNFYSNAGIDEDVASCLGSYLIATTLALIGNN